MRLFSFTRKRGLKQSALACLVASSLWAVPSNAQNRLLSLEETLKPSLEQADAPISWDSEKAAERSIRLNYVSTPWSKVLHEVARNSGSTLVMHDVPPGKYSRHDWSRHTRKDAVQILNRELEPQGFRILIKDQFLTVMQSRRTRPEYQRPVKPVAPQVQQTSAQGQEPEGVVPLGQWTAQNDVRPFPTPKKLKPLTQHAQQQAARTGINPLIEKAAYNEETTTSVKDETLTIKPSHRAALDIAKQIHRAFKTRARLEDVGPNGLPAFIVDHAQDNQKAGQTQFLIEIDTQGNRLLITASPTVQTGLQRLISQIDVNPIGEKQVPTLVAGDGNKAEIGRQLQRPLRMINQAQQRQSVENTTPDFNDQPLAQAPPMPAQNGNQTPAANDTEITAEMVGNLKGDVSIEALDDLDLLILRGNTGDVESVLEVIDRIEKMALGSLPEIHLLKLQNVDSQSLATLLNDVYEQLADLRSDNAQQSAASVSVVPVVTPNAVLILAPGNTMEAILQLAAELDQPIDPSHEVELVRLRHAVASTVVETLQEFYEEQQGLGTRLKVAADVRTNSIIIQARPRDLNEIMTFIKKIDADEADSVSQMKIYQLKNALADELAEFLNAAIQSVTDPSASTVGQTQGGQGQNAGDPKSVVLEFLAEDGQQLARSGLLNDIRFNAETRTNSLAVTAPSQSLPLIEELIRILDRPSNAVADVKYFKLQNADALDAVELLDELFTEESTGNTNNDNQSAVGVQLVGATDTSSTLLPLKFVADSRTNSVIATGGTDALIIVENLLYRLDATDPKTRTTRVIKLRNAPAADVADAINTFLQSQRELATIDPDRISTSQLLDQEVIVTPEPISNNLLISATPSYFKDIETLAQELDAEPSQVVIQALLVEVELTNNDEFGVELGFQDPVLFDRSLIDNIVTITETVFDNQGNPTSTNTRIVSQEAAPGFNFNNQPFGNNNGPAASPNTIGSQGLSNFSLGRTNSDLGYGGLVLSASSESVNVLIRALAARRTVRILSRPQIRALDNQLAQIQVGQVVPVTDGVTQTNTAVTPQIVRDPAGIILTVTPRISPEGQIVMEVVAEKSNYTDEGVVVYTDIATGAVVTSPVKNISTAQTTVKVPDGQTIVLGGMITDTEDVAERKVPWLGDLPLIGQAFRYDSQATERTELLIFLTPRIVHNDAISEHIKEVEANRLHFFQEDAEEIHGPILGVPHESGMYLPEGSHQMGLPQLAPIDGTELPVEINIPDVNAGATDLPPAPMAPAN